MGLGTRLGMSKSKMAVCTEESVSTVQTKRLKENIDIKKVKCVKCSPDNSCLLVQRLDFTLHLICIKTGQVHFVCKDVRDFMWSLPAKTTSLKKSPAFSILRNDGTVELFETKERRTDKQCSPEENCKEKLVSNVGSLTETMIKAHIVGKGEEMALKCSRLVYCKQGAANDEDRMHCVTLLFDGYLVVVLSFSILLSPDVLKWFEMVKHVSAVPFLLPQQAITDVKASDEMLFILYKHGVIIVYNLSNSTFYGWIDVFLKAESVSDTEVDAQQKRPSAKILDIDENMSTVLVCDDTNNVTKINLDKYYQHFPSHLHSRRDGSVNDSKVHNTFGQTFSPGHRDVAVHDPDVEKNLFGDTFWRAEVLSVSRELDSSTRTDTKMKGNFVRRKESNLDSETRERDDFHLQTPWSDVIVSHLWMKDFTSLDMYCSLGSFLLWLEPKERADTGDQLEINRGLLCCYVDWRRDYLVNIFIEKTFVASGGHSTRPLYLMTSSMIGLAVFGTTQNELVNKVIMYENVAMAEKLCYLNDWDHFAVPVSALEAALKHEQLDTVAFYLKTKGKAFTTIATESEAISSARALSPLSPGSFNSRQLITKPTHSEDVFEQITSVVNLLVTAIKTSSKRKHSVQFTSQLLQMSFDYVNGLMQDAVNYIERQLGQECDREKIHEILSYLTEKTMELRWFLYGIPPFTDEARRGSTGSARKEKDSGSYVSSETQEIIFKKWSGMDDKDVIGDAILNCRIPLAQVYFLDNGESFSAHDGSLRYIMESGMNLVLDVLARKDIATAIAMLKNMGEDVVELLRNICLKTFDRSLRDYLIEQLTSWDELKEEEIRAFKFLTFLESIYDNQSFESCQIRKLQHTKLEEFNDLGLLQKSFDPTSPSTKTGFLKTGSIAPQYHVSMVSRVSDGYCEVLMDWVIGWDQETRERVLLEKFFSDEKAFQKEIWNMVSGKPCWQYLKAHSEIGQVIEWISSSSESSQDSQVLPALTLEARSDLSECSCFLIEVILDELTRKGLYSKKLLTNFPLLLRHLCRTGTLFTKAHPLHGITSKDCQDLEQTLQEGETDYSLKLFHKEMMEYCSKHNFMNLLYYYLDFYRLCQTIEECEVLVPKQIHQEVDMLLKFRLAGLFPSDLSVICSMSFSNSTAVLSTSNPSLINMLSNHRPIMAIATCLYAPVDLSQILQPNSGEVLGDIWQLDETLLRSTLSCYPRLCSALFPRTGNQKLSEDPDITLYKLLQGNCSFEISSLFAWQSTNTLATRGGLLSDMPHFSQKTLVEKFAHKETLTYVYFLKHGRPSFAFITFMSKYQHRKYIPKTSISKATNKAYQLAITHFGNNRTAYSCVAFLELLGVDTLFLRIDIEAARRILHHGDKDELQCQTADELKNAVVVKLLKGSKDRQYKPKALIAILEDSTRNLISKEGLDRSSREASQFWSLPIMFCRSHNMTLTPAFLIDCAKVDKWLAFLCHAQAAQFPKNQVLSVVQHYFETNNLKEHLHQALVNVVSVNSKEAGHARRKGKFPPTRRDVRSQYLSRVIGASSSPVSKSDPLAKSIKENTELTNVLSEKTEPAHDVEPSEKDEPRHDMELESKKEVKVDDCEDDNDVNETEAKTLNEAMATNVGDINPETSPDNLFDVLSLCNETTESWRAILAHSIALKRPLFAVLAACYKDVNLVDCMCVWLCSVHDKEILHPALTNIADIHCWTLDDLQSLILTISKFGADVAHCLAKAFYLFDPNNMLLPLMRFYEAFSIHMDFVAAADQLSNFVLHHKSVLVNEDLQSQMVIGDLTWCEKISDGVVQNMLRSCQTMHTQVQLLRLLCHSRFGNGFSIRVPDFKKLYKISYVLEEGSVFARCVDLTSDESERERVLEELLQQQRFTEAQDYATLVDIPSDKVSLHQIIQKKKDIQASRLWENERERIAFWESCDRYLEEQNCATAGHFFEEESTAISVSSAEKATLLCLAFNWFSGRRNSGRTTPKSLADQAELECQMWLCIINDRVKSAEEWKSKTSLHNFTCCNVDFNVLQEQFLTIEGNSSHHISDNKVQKVLKEIIGELLDEGQITQARRLSVLFGLSTTDLDIVLSCIFLAQEIVSPESLEEDIKALLTPRESYTLSNSLKSSGSFIESLSQSQKSTDDGLNKSTEDGISTWTMVGDNLATMENLASSCRSGRICCSRVIVAYKICQTLGLVFVKVVGTDPFDLLCSLLGSSFDQRYQLAAQYIKSFNLDSNKIAQFVAKSVSTSLNVYTGSEVLDDKVLIFNPASREDMNNVMSLAEDRLVLGGFLFQEALLLAKRRKTATPSSSALTMEVELLIHAHHCQTLACNTEGISSILKLAQLCTLALTDANEYLLMVRLLTGIGRFTEMTYIFQALMDHHHFELLVKKGTDNENKLKTALLKYLDKYHFEDTEKHLLVAYRFNMHREVAISLKTSADLQVKKLVKRELNANSEVRSMLVSIAQSYTYAMENFKEEGCLLQALECAKKHRLVELQKHLLPTGMVILDLNDKSLGEFLAKYNNFFEAYIVADAYNKRSLDTWVEPLFNHVILGGDFKYFNEICSVFQVPTAILSELVVRYRSELQRNSSAIVHMKRVMRFERDILSRYKLAVELGYRDEIESIRQSEAGALVRDRRE